MTQDNGASDAEDTDDTQTTNDTAHTVPRAVVSDDSFEGLGLAAQLVATLTELGY